MKTMLGIIWLIFIFVCWTFLLISNPFGWYRLYLAVRSIFDKDIRQSAFDRWKRDDELINEWFLGKQRHTVSGRVGYWAIRTDNPMYLVMQRIINWLFWFDEHHCFVSIDWGLFDAKEKELLTLKYMKLNKLSKFGVFAINAANN